MKESIKRFKEYSFLFSELVKRDFKKKYKRTYLGMLWSLLSPLLTLLVMSVVFTRIFGRDISEYYRADSYVLYLFCGNIIFSFFSDSTSRGMTALMANSRIFSKINLPKYLFLFSTNVSSLINFGLTLIVFFVFCIFEGAVFSLAMFSLIIPILCLVVFNVGVGLILSALYVFFRDMQYLWGVFTTLLMYASAIFYLVTPSNFGEWCWVFKCNPLFVYISYFREVVLNGAVPSLEINLLAVGYALVAFLIGALMYKKCNHRFIYYV